MGTLLTVSVAVLRPDVGVWGLGLRAHGYTIDCLAARLQGLDLVFRDWIWSSGVGFGTMGQTRPLRYVHYF